MERGVTLKFKYHKSYRGFYLLDGDKFKRPYKKLDQEKTSDKVGGLNFSKKEKIKKEEVSKKTNKKVETKKTEDINVINLSSLELKYQIPAQILELLYNTISKDAKNIEKHFRAVLSVVENITQADGIFFSKVKKIFYYNSNELSLILDRYNLNNIRIEGLKKEVELDYPSQYISELPVDYKEYEMIFVFYFIILVELLAVLK